MLRTALLDLSLSARQVLDSLNPIQAREPRPSRYVDRIVALQRIVQYWSARFGLDGASDVYLLSVAGFLSGSARGLRIDSVLQAIPEQRTRIAETGVDKGAVEWLISAMPDQPRPIVAALLLNGAYNEVLRRFPGDHSGCAQALLRTGRYRELVERYAKDRLVVGEALVLSGEYEKVLREYPDQPSACASALFRLGRYAECLDRFPFDGRYGLACAFQTSSLPRLLAVAEANPEALVAWYNALRWVPELYERYRAGGGMKYTVSAAYTYPGTLLDMGRPAEAAEISINPDIILYSLVRRGMNDSMLTFTDGNLSLKQEAWAARGDYDSILASPIATARTAETFMRTARIDVLKKQHPLRRTVAAELLLQLGRPHEVLRDYRDQPLQCAQALLALGLPDSVLRTYPGQWAVCNDALLAKGEFELSRSTYPEFYVAHAQALLAAGRNEDLARGAELSPRQRGLALARLGRFSDATLNGTVRKSDMEAVEVIHRIALEQWVRGQRIASRATRGSPRYFSFDRSWWHLRFDQFLLGAVLEALDGSPAQLDSTCARIMRDYPTHCARQIWHEAAWLSGTITDEQFLNQPHQLGVADRMAFLRAIRADLRGDRSAALQLYRQVSTLPRYPTAMDPMDIFESWNVRDFITWRLSNLRPQ